MPYARRVHFVLPAYNESASIEDLLKRIASVCRDAGFSYDVLVVDDGSSDGTGDLAEALAPSIPVEVVQNDPNRGLGVTIRRGLRHAAERSDPDDIIVTLDADLTQDPAYVPAMLARLDDGADVVIASRFQRGASVEGLSVFRRGISRLAGLCVSLVRPIPGVRDYSCGFRAYRASVIQWGFQTYGDGFVTEAGFGCMVEISERLRGHSRFAEVPFTLHYDAKRKASEIRIWPTILAYMRVMRRLAAEERAA